MIRDWRCGQKPSQSVRRMMACSTFASLPARRGDPDGREAPLHSCRSFCSDTHSFSNFFHIYLGRHRINAARASV